MKRSLTITLAIALATGGAWVATVYHAPRLLESEVRAVAQKEFDELEREVKRVRPDGPSMKASYSVALPIVRIDLCAVPAPFVFKARCEVRHLPEEGEIRVSWYIYTPWRIYVWRECQMNVLDSGIKDYAEGFTNPSPNQRLQGTPESVPSSSTEPEARRP